MPRNANIVGPNVIKFRHQHGWTQDELVSKLNLLGYYFTRDIVANIESRRSVVKDVQISALAEAFGVDEGALFPAKRQAGQTMWLVDQLTNRQRRRHTGGKPSADGQ